MGYIINNPIKLQIFSKIDFSCTTLLNSIDTAPSQVLAGFPVVDVIDDSLDSFVFEIKDYPTKKPFQPFDLVEFTVSNEEPMQYFILNDQVKSYSRGSKTYTHTVACVETTKYLEKIKCYSMNLTNVNHDALDKVLLVCTNIEPTIEPYLDSEKRGRRFTVSRKLQYFLQGKASGEFYFRQTDLRSILDEILSYYNARIVVEHVYFNSVRNVYEFSLDYQPIDKATDIKADWTMAEHGEIVFEEVDSNGQDYAGKIVARGYNSESQIPVTVRDYPKASSAQLTDSNICLFVPFPISDKGIKSLTVKVDISMELFMPDFDSGWWKAVKETVNFDLTSSLIRLEEYDLLSIADKEKKIPYDKGSMAIVLSGTYKRFLFEHIKISDFINERAKQYVKEKEEKTGNTYRFSGVTDFKNAMYTVIYYPVIDSADDITKEGVYNPNQLLMGIMDAQAEQKLDIDRHGKKLSSLISRVGNDEYRVDVKAMYYSKLMPLLSRISVDNDQYILFKREFSIYDNFVNCRYHFSRNYTAVQENAGINRERQIYSIPLENEPTPFVIKKYLSFSFEKQTPGCCFGKEFFRAFLRTFMNEDHDSRICEYCLLQTGKYGDKDFPGEKDGNSQCFVLPVVGYAKNRALSFTAKCLDNYSVGYSRSGYTFSAWGDGGNVVRYNCYVNEDQGAVGEIRSSWLDFAVNVYSSNGGQIESPLTLEDSPVAKKSAFLHLTKESIRLNKYKDRTETPVYTLLVECVPAESAKGKIFIGRKLVQNNNLIVPYNENNYKLKLYAFNSLEFKGNADTLPLDHNGTELELSDYFTIYSDDEGKGGALQFKGTAQPLENIRAWAIADENGNIYIAVNGEMQTIRIYEKDLP